MFRVSRHPTNDTTPTPQLSIHPLPGHSEPQLQVLPWLCCSLHLHISVCQVLLCVQVLLLQVSVLLCQPSLTTCKTNADLHSCIFTRYKILQALRGQDCGWPGSQFHLQHLALTTQWAQNADLALSVHQRNVLGCYNKHTGQFRGSKSVFLKVPKPVKCKVKSLADLRKQLWSLLMGGFPSSKRTQLFPPHRMEGTDSLFGSLSKGPDSY